MANSPVVTTLPAYVDQNTDLLTARSVFGAKSLKYFTLVPGVKYKKALNELETAVTFGAGGTCGWSEAGTSTLSQRELAVGKIKVNMAFCHEKLMEKYATHEVGYAAGHEKLPFEEKFINDIIKGINKNVEKGVWNGDTTSSDANLNKFDGLIKILNADSDTVKTTIASGKSYMEAVKQVLAAIPDEVIDSAEGDEDGYVAIFCSPSFRRAYMQELVDANLYHFKPGDDLSDIIIPGSDAHLVAAPGIGTSKKLVAARIGNLYYGCDIPEGKEMFDFFWAKEAQEFRFVDKFTAGVQVAFPAEAVLGTYTTLTSPSSVSVNIAALANADHIFKTDEQE